MGVPLKQGRKNSNFLTTYARHIKFSELANNAKRSNLTKFGGIKMGVPPQMGPPKFSIFKT